MKLAPGKGGIKSLIYIFGDETANRVNSMQHMLASRSSCFFSSLDIRKVSKKLV